MNSEMFENLEVNKLFFRCVVPSVITCVFAAIYTAADGFFVGKFIGEDALAAVNLIMPVLLIVVAFINMIATGASVNISMLLGKKEYEEASKVFSFSIKVIFVLSIVLGILGVLFGRQFLLLIAPSASIAAIDAGTAYLKVFSVLAPILTVYFATDNYLRACGRMKTSMAVAIVSQTLNIILDLILVVFLHKGIMAVALATGISIALGSIYTLILFIGDKLELNYTLKNISLRSFLRILANGSSEFFSSISFSVMSIIMNIFLLMYGGTTAVAAFAIVIYVDSIIGMVCFGICEALQPAISYCYGAGLIERTKSIFSRVLIASAIVSVLAFLFMFLLGPYVSHIFMKPDDTALAEMSRAAIRIFAFSYFAGWIDMCFSSFFTAIDKPGYSLIVSITGTLVVPVVLLFILTEPLGLNGVWLMSPLASVISGIVTLLLAYRMKMQLKES